MANIKDSYQNLTLKVGMLFHWAKNNCPQAKYFFKVDDDMFINVKRVSALIQCINNQNNDCDKFQERELMLKTYKDPQTNQIYSYTIIGFVYNRLFPIRDPNSKWYLSSDLYPNSSLPYFVSGTSYLLTNNLIPLVLNGANSKLMINLEDVYFTGIILSDHYKLSLTHMNNWSNFRPRWDDICYYRQLLTAHGLTPAEIIKFNNEIKLPNSHCDNWYRKFLIRINEFFTYYVPRSN